MTVRTLVRACVMLTLWWLPALVVAATPPEFKRARNLYEYGDYEACIPLLEELVLPGRLEDEKEAEAAHRMLGVAYHQTGRQAEAAREFKSLLYLDPDAQLDPFLVPPAVVEFFENVKAEMNERLPELREQRARERAAREARAPTQGNNTGGKRAVEATPSGRTVVRRVRVVPVPALFLPGGIPQFLMGHWVRGALVLGVQLLAPLPNVLFFMASRALVWGCLPLPADATAVAGGKIPEQRCQPLGTDNGILRSDPRYNIHIALQVGQYVSLLLIPAAYLVGVVDALILPRLEVPEGETVIRPAPGPATGAADARTPPDTPPAAVDVAPPPGAVVPEPAPADPPPSPAPEPPPDHDVPGSL